MKCRVCLSCTGKVFSLIERGTELYQILTCFRAGLSQFASALQGLISNISTFIPLTQCLVHIAHIASKISHVTQTMHYILASFEHPVSTHSVKNGISTHTAHGLTPLLNVGELSPLLIITIILLIFTQDFIPSLHLLNLFEFAYYWQWEPNHCYTVVPRAA